ncbi:MAG: type II toxin-antitoxin system HicB family antitoxin [Candidatus Zixiibacteriota bacterium]
MEKILKIKIEKLPEGLYLATSDSIQGLIAQGRTVTETLEIARDVARKLLEAQEEREDLLPSVEDKFEYPLIIGN